MSVQTMLNSFGNLLLLHLLLSLALVIFANKIYGEHHKKSGKKLAGGEEALMQTLNSDRIWQSGLDKSTPTCHSRHKKDWNQNLKNLSLAIVDRSSTNYNRRYHWFAAGFRTGKYLRGVAIKMDSENVWGTEIWFSRSKNNFGNEKCQNQEFPASFETFNLKPAEKFELCGMINFQIRGNPWFTAECKMDNAQTILLRKLVSLGDWRLNNVMLIYDNKSLENYTRDPQKKLMVNLKPQDSECGNIEILIPDGEMKDLRVNDNNCYGHVYSYTCCGLKENQSKKICGNVIIDNVRHDFCAIFKSGFNEEKISTTTATTSRTLKSLRTSTAGEQSSTISDAQLATSHATTDTASRVTTMSAVEMSTTDKESKDKTEVNNSTHTTSKSALIIASAVVANLLIIIIVVLYTKNQTEK